MFILIVIVVIVINIIVIIVIIIVTIIITIMTIIRYYSVKHGVVSVVIKKKADVNVTIKN